MIRIELPFPVSVNRAWRAGRGRVYKSKPYVRWLKAADGEWMVQKAPGRFKTVEGPFRAQLKLSRPDKRSRDCDNLTKGVLDWAQHAGIIANDKHCMDLRVGWVTDEEAPMGAVLIITPIDN